MRLRTVLFVAVLAAVLLLLHGIPWWRLVLAPAWPTPVTVVGSVLALAALVGFPIVMGKGHGRAGRDGLAVLGDTWLGVVWQLFTISILGGIADLVLAVAGVHGPSRPRVVAAVCVAVTAASCGWSAFQARRIPRVRTVQVPLARLGAGLDGLRVVMITDTHFGPINRGRWSAGVVDRVNSLAADVLVHAGDLADGSIEKRRHQVEPLRGAAAALERVYVTGNHEYRSGAASWVAQMEELGWTALRNRHLVVEKGGSAMILAGIDDLTAAGSGVAGHGADLAAALSGADPDLPVVLLAHQPKQVRTAAAAGVDLQLSGHTHGGQIWPFHYLVRAEQGALAGLSWHRAAGASPLAGTPERRTALYTSRGTGFWGPPFRLFAPSEITLLVLRAVGA